MSVDEIMEGIEAGCAILLSPQTIDPDDHEASAEVFVRLIECLAFLLAVKADGDSKVLDLSVSLAEATLCDSAVSHFNLLKKVTDAKGD